MFDLSSAINEDCGKKSKNIAAGTSFGGESTNKGEWPWLVAINDRFQSIFLCGGSLLSRLHVLTGLMVN